MDHKKINHKEKLSTCIVLQIRLVLLSDKYTALEIYSIALKNTILLWQSHNNP